MEAINDNIRQLLEMLDNPDAYTEQEIQDIINRDEDTRETYRLMVEAKRSSHRQADKPADVDAAWQRFNQRLRMGDGTSGMGLKSKQHDFGWMKIAASFIGILFISVIALAAIHIVRQRQKQEAPKTEITESVKSPATKAPADTLTNNTASVKPVIYDNIRWRRCCQRLPPITMSRSHLLTKKYAGSDSALYGIRNRASIRSSAISTSSSV